MWKRIALLACCVTSLSSMAQADIQACGDTVTRQVDFTDAEAPDTLTVSVSGKPCSQATFSLQVHQADGTLVYSYSGAFIDHMPYLIYEPELNHLVSYFVQRVAGDALSRKTNDLPVYTGYEAYYESTNDFVVVPDDEYEKLRHSAMPMLWHATGDSSWVSVVYQPEKHHSEVVLRGGVFR